MPIPRQRRVPIKSKSPAIRSMMVRLDDESKSYLLDAAKLRGISLSDYVRDVTVSQARREVIAAREQVLTMTPEEQLAFWNALNAPITITESQKRLGAIMKGEA